MAERRARLKLPSAAGLPTHAPSIVYVHSRTLFSANKLGPEMLGNSSSDGKL